MSEPVQVRSIQLEKFTRHASTQVTLPERGVVLVRGPNGGGKSSLVEGVAWALWGETLRGTRPTEEGSAGVGLEGGHAVVRSRAKGKAAVRWEGHAAADTATKAQEGLDATFGTFEAWRRTHVFSSQDAAHFTLATDKERKLFLEGLLGLGRFDDALEACREDLRATEKRLAEIAQKAAMAHARLEGLNARRADAERTLETLAPPPAVLKPDLRAPIDAAERAVRSSRAAAAEVQTRKGENTADARALEARLARLTKPGAVCGECKRPLPVDVEAIERLSREAREARERAEEACRMLDEELAYLRDQAAEDEATLNKLRERVRAAERASAAAEATERARAQAVKTLEDAARQLEQARTEAAAVVAEMEPLTLEEKILAACDAVLGLKGVRAGILAKLLGGLEAAANAWLSKMAAPGLRLELKPYSEKKAGGVSDAISLQVHGAGGGLGYRAASGGERRRIDVAVLLAFAGRGTLFFDEVFDALDPAGVEAVAGVLAELSRDRCVVVITHNDDLGARVPHAAAWYVSEGRLSAG